MEEDGGIRGRGGVGLRLYIQGTGLRIYLDLFLLSVLQSFKSISESCVELYDIFYHVEADIKCKEIYFILDTRNSRTTARHAPAHR